ncbi:MAG: DivIVA domain-containing protein [Clostridia bacterium]|nr:DivIVA domain-containing protein [Clostridia bacterium]
MITPMEIQTKKFEKSVVGGYNKHDVDDFMLFVLEDYENLYKQVSVYEDRINALTKQLDSYKSMEDTMKNSLLIAQSTAENVQKNANDRAEIIIKEAQDKAKEIISNANKGVEQATADMANIKHTMDIYKCQAISMLNAQIENLKKFDANEE